MGHTPDDIEGGLTDTAKVIMRDEGETLNAPGEFRWNSVTGAYEFLDGTGTFDPRSGGGISEAQHKALRQLIHFISDGPAEGFASGAYREVTGTVFPTAIVWYEDGTKAKKIVSRDVTWTGAKETQSVWKVYDTDGSTVLATVTDAISYSGVFETSRTRTIA